MKLNEFAIQPINSADDFNPTDHSCVTRRRSAGQQIIALLVQPSDVQDDLRGLKRVHGAAV